MPGPAAPPDEHRRIRARTGPVPVLLQDLLWASAGRSPDHPALGASEVSLTYGGLAEQVERTAAGLRGLGLGAGERVAIYLPRSVEAVTACFGTATAGGVFVPVNPVLKPAQVAHVLADSGAALLVTSKLRLSALEGVLHRCPALRTLVLSDATGPGTGNRVGWQAMTRGGTGVPHRTIDTDLAALFYTSGSTGLPKGVMISHRNLVAGAASVAGYLELQPDDHLLALLPLSFDAGFSQLTTGFLAGAQVSLLEYLLPADAVRAIADRRITGLTGVPPLWAQLADADWPAGATDSVRFIASTGGPMPAPLLQRLRRLFSHARPYLMYGLTEAFRSTYLPPEEIDRRPGSIGRAIPNAEVLVLRDDGTQCAPGEAGELVHRGSLVSLGYWRAPELTAQRFRPVPGERVPGGVPERAVWSGDTVVADADGFLYFRGRRDELIKSSGYRISPEEVEAVVLASPAVAEAVAFGIPDGRLGQAVAVAAVARNGTGDTDGLLRHCREQLPAHMVPTRILWRGTLPRNPNGKYDRTALRVALAASCPEPDPP